MHDMRQASALGLLCFLVIAGACQQMNDGQLVIRGMPEQRAPSQLLPTLGLRPVQPFVGACRSTKAVFQRDVWSGFMSRACAGCHTLDGSAVERGARFILQRENSPAFLDYNLAAVRTIALEDVAGLPKILAKAQGLANHGGGVVLSPSGSEFLTLAELVRTLRSGQEVSCPPQDHGVFDGLQLLSNRDTLRKAALGVAGTVPSSAMLDLAVTDEGLDRQLDELLRQEGFYDWLKDSWNDVLLVRRGLTTGSPGLDDFDPADFPRVATYKASPTSDDAALVQQAIVEQPLELIEYITREDRPFSEILTAQYTVVNPWLADLLGVGGLPTPSKENKGYWQVVRAINARQGSTPIAMPLSGVLTTPAFLGRYPTTPSNRSRGRARQVMKIFLGTDVLTLATRPIDATQLTTVINATRNSATCAVCHQFMEPVSGFFMGFGEADGKNYSYDPNRAWHGDMFPAGFNGQLMPATDYQRAVNWGGTALANDRRFALAVTQHMYRALTQAPLLPYPMDSADPRFEQKLRAWTAQDEYLQGLATRFAERGYSLKWLLKQLIKGPYYRGIGHESTEPEVLAVFGAGKLLTPEQLSRKIFATTGVRFGRGYITTKLGIKPHETLIDDHYLAAGGIDSAVVVTRPTSFSTIGGALLDRMAAQVACVAVPYDFSKSDTERALFPGIDLAQVPLVPDDEGAAMNPNPAGEEHIRKGLVSLYARLLGREFGPNDEPINDAYDLYVDVWRDLRQTGNVQLSRGGVGAGCSAEVDPNQPVSSGVLGMGGTVTDHAVQSLPTARRITTDPNFTLRAWQAVVWYLLADPSFLTE